MCIPSTLEKNFFFFFFPSAPILLGWSVSVRSWGSCTQSSCRFIDAGFCSPSKKWNTMVLRPGNVRTRQDEPELTEGGELRVNKVVVLKRVLTNTCIKAQWGESCLGLRPEFSPGQTDVRWWRQAGSRGWTCFYFRSDPRGLKRFGWTPPRLWEGCEVRAGAVPRQLGLSLWGLAGSTCGWKTKWLHAIQRSHVNIDTDRLSAWFAANRPHTKQTYTTPPTLPQSPLSLM